MLVIFAAEIAALAAFVSDDSDFLRDAVKMNEAVHSAVRIPNQVRQQLIFKRRELHRLPVHRAHE